MPAIRGQNKGHQRVTFDHAERVVQRAISVAYNVYVCPPSAPPALFTQLRKPCPVYPQTPPTCKHRARRAGSDPPRPQCRCMPASYSPCTLYSARQNVPCLTPNPSYLQHRERVVQGAIRLAHNVYVCLPPTPPALFTQLGKPCPAPRPIPPAAHRVRRVGSGPPRPGCVCLHRAARWCTPRPTPHLTGAK